MTVKFTIKLEPVTKKNSQQIFRNPKTGKSFISPSAKYKEYKSAALWFMPKLPEPISESCCVKCIFYMPTRRKCDLTNLLEAVDDIMVDAGVLEDDNYRIIASHDGSRVYYDKDNPRTEVEVTSLEDM